MKNIFVKAEIITIGNEILIGQIVDTNSAFLAEKLNELGVSVIQINSIPDKPDIIVSALNDASYRADIIIITGGLGPTNDDITKQTLASYFNSDLVMNMDVLEQIRLLLSSRGVTMNENNRLQALLPETCEVLKNRHGTAQGMLFNKSGKIFVALPGVPYEMKGIFTEELAPLLKARYKLPVIIHRTALTSGIAESHLAKLIEKWELSLPEHISLAYLPSPGIVRLRLSGTSIKEEMHLREEINNQMNRLEEIIQPWIYGYDNDTLEEITGKLLKAKSYTLSLAESCTGGKVSSMITSVPGCSDYFKGSCTAYSNQVKADVLGVNYDKIEHYGAVSREVATEMAYGARKVFRTDFAVSVTGIAGPTGGTDTKPVGTTWIAVASPQGIKAEKYQFGEHRERNIQKASITALFMLRNAIRLCS